MIFVVGSRAGLVPAIQADASRATEGYAAGLSRKRWEASPGAHDGLFVEVRRG